MSFLLERIRIIGSADDRELVRDHFPALSLPLRRDQLASHRNRSTRDQALVLRVIRQRILHDDLQVLQRRAVVQLDEGKSFRIAARPHPALHPNGILGPSGICSASFSRSRGSHMGNVAQTSGICESRTPLRFADTRFANLPLHKAFEVRGSGAKRNIWRLDSVHSPGDRGDERRD